MLNKETLKTQLNDLSSLNKTSLEAIQTENKYSWEWFVSKEIERLNENETRLTKILNDIIYEIMVLKIKSGIWGFVGAAIPIVILLAINFLKN